MKKRRPWLWALSATVTIALTFLLIRIGKLDVRVTLQQLRSVSLRSFAALALLTAVHIYLSSVKWRCVDARLRRAADPAPSRTMSFAFTSLGVTLGQLLPVQLSMSLARTLGTYFYGKALKRGTGGTLFEQVFDVAIVCFLAVASAVTLLCNGGGILWLTLAAAMVALAMFMVGPAIRLVRRLPGALHHFSIAPADPLFRGIAGLENSGLLDRTLGRQLMGLSVARFAVQVLMAGQAAEAIRVDIPLWHLAAAMPFVVIACVLVMTPAGLGVNELSYAATLHMFGTPLHSGVQWALANRFLVASSCLLVAVCAAVVAGISQAVAIPRPASLAREK